MVPGLQLLLCCGKREVAPLPLLAGQVLAALNSTDLYPSSIAKIMEEPSRSPPLRQLRLAVRGVWCAGCGDLFAEAPASRNYSDYLHSRPSAVHPALPHAAGRSGYGYGQAKRPVLKLAGSGLQDLWPALNFSCSATHRQAQPDAYSACRSCIHDTVWATFDVFARCTTQHFSRIP